MIAAAAIFAAALSGQALALPPMPAKGASAAQADLSRCLASQAARIERLEENLESVARLSVKECDGQFTRALHAAGAPTVADYFRQLSDIQKAIGATTVAAEIARSPTHPPLPPSKLPNLGNMGLTTMIGQRAELEAAHDAIAAREARLSAHKN